MPPPNTTHDHAPRLALNFDILLGIMGLLDLQDTSRMMRTCWTMYRGGIKYLLDDVQIVSEDQAISFSHFMLTEKGSRFPHLHNLTLLLGSVSETVAQTLISVLRNAAPYLKVLDLDGCDDFLDSAKDLPDAVASLTSLHELNVGLASKTTCTVLTTLHAPVSRLSLEYVTFLDDLGITFFQQFDTEEEIAAVHPLTVCSAFASTLEELHFSFETYLEILPGPRSAPIYSRLHTLRLSNDWPRVPPYIAATPYVTQLFIKGAMEGAYAFFQNDPESFLRLREDNRQAQLAGGSWIRLTKLDAEPYLCGLTCQVPHVTLGRIKLYNVRLLRDVLRDVRPTSLTLNVADYLFDTLEWHIPALLLDECSASVTHLTIFWDINEKRS